MALKEAQNLKTSLTTFKKSSETDRSSGETSADSFTGVRTQLQIPEGMDGTHTPPTTRVSTEAHLRKKNEKSETTGHEL
jgi:hypothetical protein